MSKMDPFTSFKFPPPSTQPLQTLSPERVNGTRPASAISTTTPTHKSELTSETTDSHDIFDTSPTRKARANLFTDYSPQKLVDKNSITAFTLPQSPSLPEIHALRSGTHVRTNSDVQGLVKRFEHLDVRDKDAESVERRKRHEAELRRALIAREEAESDVRRLREEVRRLKRDGEEGRERERKVGRRLEVVLEESVTAKEACTSQSSIYEKELRKSRKEAFKSSSAVLKLQEELKSTRNTLRITQSGFELEKQKVQRKEQERFEMEYTLIPLQEEVEKLRQKLRVSEEERDALKTNLREEEVARIAAEGMIALPVSQHDVDDLDLMSSPRKKSSPQKRSVFLDSLEEDKENINLSPSKKGALETRRLAEELEQEKLRREEAEDLADFLRIECMFRCCGCKRLGHEFALEMDAELAAGVERVREGMEGILASSDDLDEKDEVQIEIGGVAMDVVENEDVEEMKVEETSIPLATDTVMADNDGDNDNDNVDRSRTIGAESPDQEQPPNSQPHDDEAALETAAQHPTSFTGATPQLREQPSTPPRPHQSTFLRNPPSIKTITTTTTIPMHFTPASKPYPPVFTEEDAENIPPTATKEGGVIDRAAALAAIEYRRGRAKSLANGQATPRKQMLEGVGVGGRRDISAPALGQQGKRGQGKVMGGSVRGMK